MNWCKRLFDELEAARSAYLAGEYTDEETGERGQWDGEFSELFTEKAGPNV